MKPDVVVVGSINHDLTVLTSRHPQIGETVLGAAHYTGSGGKGANQAVAAARLGARVVLIGRVGDDEHGRALLAGLADESVDTSHIGVDLDDPTGLAVITIDEEAENTIVVSPGANMRLRPEHLDSSVISEASVVLAQLEVPLDTITAAARMARGTFILNPAPARPLPALLLDDVDILVPNRSELAVISGKDDLKSLIQIEDAARSIGRDPIVVTLGADGALLITGKGTTEFTAPEVEAVDPTGAGDAFCAALAHGLSTGMDPGHTVRRAVVAGALATTRAGAQPGMPTDAELRAALGR